jgi:hypothetical protein
MPGAYTGWRIRLVASPRIRSPTWALAIEHIDIRQRQRAAACARTAGPDRAARDARPTRRDERPDEASRRTAPHLQVRRLPEGAIDGRASRVSARDGLGRGCAPSPSF